MPDLWLQRFRRARLGSREQADPGDRPAQRLASPTRTRRPDIARHDRPRARDGGAGDAGDLGSCDAGAEFIVPLKLSKLYRVSVDEVGLQ